MLNIHPHFKTELKQIPRESPFRTFRRTAARLQRSDVRASEGTRGMRPNYGNKRVYLEGEEKYHFRAEKMGKSVGEGGRGQQKGRRGREGARWAAVGDGGALPLHIKV